MDAAGMEGRRLPQPAGDAAAVHEAAGSRSRLSSVARNFKRAHLGVVAPGSERKFRLVSEGLSSRDCLRVREGV